jgi:hypothetical protein
MIVCVVCVLAVFLGSTMISVSTQTLDHRVFFTFSAPVEVPGVGLAPGKYLFRVADPDMGGKVVQVLTADGTKTFATFFAIPAERPEPAEQPEVRFIETPPGVPPAIKTWWYPGERTGREFIYPKDQAIRLAHAASEPVLTTERHTTKAEETKTGNLTRVSANGQETPVSADAKPTAGTPRGQALQGENAPAATK